MAATVIPKTWAMIDARFPLDIARLVLDYFIHYDEYVDRESAAGSWEYCAEVCGMGERTILIVAAVDQEYDEIAELLMNGIEISGYGLHEVYDSNMEAYAFIVNHERFTSWEALLAVSAWNGIDRGVRAAIDRGAHKLDDALWAACKNNHEETADLLIESGANQCNWHGDSRDGREACFRRVLGYATSDDDEDDAAEDEDDDDTLIGGQDGDCFVITPNETNKLKRAIAVQNLIMSHEDANECGDDTDDDGDDGWIHVYSIAYISSDPDSKTIDTVRFETYGGGPTGGYDLRMNGTIYKWHADMNGRGSSRVHKRYLYLSSDEQYIKLSNAPPTGSTA